MLRAFFGGSGGETERTVETFSGVRIRNCFPRGEAAVPTARRVGRSLRYLASCHLGALAGWPLICGVLLAQGLSVIVVGIPLGRFFRGIVKRVAERDRRLAAEFLGRGTETVRPDGIRPPADFRPWRELCWIAVNAAVGLPAGFFALVLIVGAAVSLTTPLWWWALPEGIAVNPVGQPVESWSTALLTPVGGLGYVAALVLAVPRMAELHARTAHGLLTAVGRAGVAARLAEVTASRSEALEAHGAELRRIERDLHDGTQNRLVAVRMHLGLVERMLHTDPDRAAELIRTARGAADDALAELRQVVRSIYPPILADRGLASAVSALAARCPLPCTVETAGLSRAPAALEGTAYFVVAEALTNAVKHADAAHVRVELRGTGTALHIEVTDDGKGGASEEDGTGLVGIRRRVAAFDGRTEVVSPAGGPTVIRVVLPCAS